MFIIAKVNTDELMFDILLEEGEPIIFKTEMDALRYIDIICEENNIPSDIYMLNYNIEICRMH